MVILIQQRLVDLAGAKFPLPYKQCNDIRCTTREVLPSTLPTTVIPSLLSVVFLLPYSPSFSLLVVLSLACHVYLLDSLCDCSRIGSCSSIVVLILHLLILLQGLFFVMYM